MILTPVESNLITCPASCWIFFFSFCLPAGSLRASLRLLNFSSELIRDQVCLVLPIHLNVEGTWPLNSLPLFFFLLIPSNSTWVFLFCNSNKPLFNSAQLVGIILSLLNTSATLCFTEQKQHFSIVLCLFLSCLLCLFYEFHLFLAENQQPQDDI